MSASFKDEKSSIANRLYHEYNISIFKNKLPSMTIKWSNKLLSTAGLCHQKRTKNSGTNPDKSKKYFYSASITLSCKLVDDIGKHFFTKIMSC